jgi:hypothetical protein
MFSWSWLAGASVAASVACGGDRPPRAEPHVAEVSVTPAPPPAGTFDALGPEFTDLGEVGPEFTFDVPAGTLGFSLDVPKADVIGVWTPDGEPYVSNNVVRGAHLASPRLLVPLTTDTLTVTPGMWKVRLSRRSPVQIARQRTSDGAFHGGVLDLFVYLPSGVHAEDSLAGVVPGDVIDAASAPKNPIFKAKIDAFFALTKRLLGLDRGAVEIHDVDAKYLRLPDPASQAEAHSLGRAAGDGRIGLRVLLTENLGDESIRGFGPVAGGPFPNLPNNTVLIDVTDSDSPTFAEDRDDELATAREEGITTAGAFATTLLHETGHLWGLGHTSELLTDPPAAGGAIPLPRLAPLAPPDNDGLDDTGTCSQAMIGDPNAIDACPDAHNLMFPAVTGSERVQLSPAQLRVLRGTAAYRPYAGNQRFVTTPLPLTLN